MWIVSENSKSLKSPSTATSAFGSAARIESTKSFTICACWWRCSSEPRVGGDDAVVDRTAVVLDLLDSDQVGRPEVGHDEAGERVELGRPVARVEVLDVERRDRNLGEPWGGRRLPLLPAIDAADGDRDLEEEVAEVVVDDADERTAVAVADVQLRHGDDRIVRDEPLGVAVVRPQQEPAASRPDVRVCAAVADDGRLTERVRGTDRDRVV